MCIHITHTVLLCDLICLCNLLCACFYAYRSLIYCCVSVGVGECIYVASFEMAEELLLNALHKNFLAILELINWDVLTPALKETQFLLSDEFEICRSNKDKLGFVIKRIKDLNGYNKNLNGSKLFLEILENLEDDPDIQKLIQILKDSKDPGMSLNSTITSILKIMNLKMK